MLDGENEIFEHIILEGVMQMVFSHFDLILQIMTETATTQPTTQNNIKLGLFTIMSQLIDISGWYFELCQYIFGHLFIFKN